MTTQQQSEEIFSNELLCAIGRMFLAFASAEAALEMQLTRLISHPSTLQSLTALTLSGTKFSVLIQQIQILSRFRVHAKQLPDVLKTCDSIRNSFDTRNDLAHYSPGRGPDKNKVRVQPLKMRANGALVGKKIYSIAQINEAAIKVDARVRRLNELLTAGGVAPLPKSVSLKTQQL